MRCREVTEEGNYCHHFSLDSIIFQKAQRKMCVPRKSQIWVPVYSLDALTVSSDAHFSDWKCNDYIPFITLSLSLLKILITQIFFFKYFCFLYLFYFFFLKSFITVPKNMSIACYFFQLQKKKICQGTTNCILRYLRKLYSSVSVPKVVCCDFFVALMFILRCISSFVSRTEKNTFLET